MSVELAEKHDYIYGAVGVHPHGAAEVPPDYLDQLRQLSRHPKVKAIGEIGLVITMTGSGRRPKSGI